MDKKQFVVILASDAEGPIYLGKLDLGRQGVRRITNAIRYKTRESAETIAMSYGPETSVARYENRSA